MENTKQRLGRDGTRMLGAHVGEDVKRLFKTTAAEQGKTVQALLEEAVEDLFKKYGKKLQEDSKKK